MRPATKRHNGGMKQQWDELNPTFKAVLVTLGALDAALRIGAMIDLARRKNKDVNGPKAGWAWALSVVHSAGLLPALYFLKGRKR